MHQGYTEVYILKYPFKDKFNFHLEDLTTREILTLFRSRFMMSCTSMLRNGIIYFSMRDNIQLTPEILFQINTESNKN